MAARYRGTMCTGVTADMSRLAFQRRSGAGSAFTKTYRLDRLVCVERHDEIENAIARERAIEKWRRDWKIELVEATNADWRDLFETLNA